MMVAAVQLSDALQALIDSRLDTIDRILMGRVPRQERLAIVRDVESQIHEQLQERGGEEQTRENVLAVLARLDPPEAYLPEHQGVAPAPRMAPEATSFSSVAQRRHDQRTLASASAILGMVAMTAIVLFPLGYGAGAALQNEFVILSLWGLATLLMLVGGVLALIFGVRARRARGWAITGFVLGCSSLVGLVLACGCLVLVFLVS
jgi:hypothetical protein